MDSKAVEIILADDDDNDRLIFREALEELKMKTIVHTVNEGIELMEYLEQDNVSLPHILFLDLNMPLKDGLQCLKEIRSKEQWSDIIVAIYSTSSSEKDIQETFANGANVYIKKPSDFGELKQVLNKVISTASVYRQPPFSVANFVFRI